VNGELRRPGTGARRILNQTLPTPCQALSPKSFWLGFLDLALVARRGVGRLTEALAFDNYLIDREIRHH
jgi:hypothetical protein